MGDFSFRTEKKNVEWLADLYDKGRLDLSPAFQRDSVWIHKDREKLIESVLRGYPLPSIFVHRTNDGDGNSIYAVIDGKQRLETFFMFMGKSGLPRSFKKARIDYDDGPEDLTWTMLVTSSV